MFTNVILVLEGQFCLLTRMDHSDQVTQWLGPPAGVEQRVNVQTEDVVGLVNQLVLYQLLYDLHPSGRDLLPAVWAGHQTRQQLNGDEEEKEMKRS